MLNDKDMTLHNIDLTDFIKTLDHCKGDVFMETADGDVLNLKSKLCQIIGIANILKGSEISEATIHCTTLKMKPYFSALTFTKRFLKRNNY